MKFCDCQDLPVLSSAVALRYYYCCTDGSTSPGNCGYPLVLVLPFSNLKFHSWSSVAACTWLSSVYFKYPGPASCVANVSSCSRLKHTILFNLQFSSVLPSSPPPDLVSFDWKPVVHDEYTGSLQKNRETSIKSQWKNHRSFAVCLLIFRRHGGVLNWKDLHVLWINLMFLSCSGLEKWEYGHRGSGALTTWHPLSPKVGSNFADKRRLLGRIVRSRTQATELVRVVNIM
jgi:hypothetical protein